MIRIFSREERFPLCVNAGATERSRCANRSVEGVCAKGASAVEQLLALCATRCLHTSHALTRLPLAVSFARMQAPFAQLTPIHSQRGLLSPSHPFFFTPFATHPFFFTPFATHPFFFTPFAQKPSTLATLTQKLPPHSALYKVGSYLSVAFAAAL